MKRSNIASNLLSVKRKATGVGEITSPKRLRRAPSDLNIPQLSIEEDTEGYVSVGSLTSFKDSIVAAPGWAESFGIVFIRGGRTVPSSEVSTVEQLSVRDTVADTPEFLIGRREKNKAEITGICRVASRASKSPYVRGDAPCKHC
ncbi:hypothetical protein FH972_021640 [Carpinus fangiana]|uniref:Uncharacterized protein n=1 Tax=Carpinus fangiana TaxID=176857 RepID=A0A5N6KPY1_9ROSI|nr:hypothetical protein FH972_021640 [Carpinus fangiana]